MIQVITKLLFFYLLGTSSFTADNGGGETATDTEEDLKRNRITVIGHAGSGFVYPIFPFNPLPPNSIASFEKSLLKNGADGVEADVQLSKDSVLILLHDGDLSSVIGVDGCVSELKAEEIVGKKHDTGFFYNFFHSEEVVSFDQFLSWFSTLESSPELHLDLKNFDPCSIGDPERAKIFAEVLYNKILEYSLAKEKMVLLSSDTTMLLHLKELDPGLRLMLDENADFENGMQWCLEKGLAGMVIGRTVASKERIKQAHEEGLQVVLFGGRSRATIKEFVAMQPDAIQVNNVKALRSLLP